MEIITYVITGALVGTFIGWFAADAQSVSAVQAEKDAAAKRFSALEKEFAAYRETMSSKMDKANEGLREKLLEIEVLKGELTNRIIESSVAEE